jgi:hypothetical protein
MKLQQEHPYLSSEEDDDREALCGNIEGLQQLRDAIDELLLNGKQAAAIGDGNLSYTSIKIVTERNEAPGNGIAIRAMGFAFLAILITLLALAGVGFCFLTSLLLN